jgi:hypothetical protein
MVVCDGQTKVAQYGQWDHYPSGQGIVALKFLQDIMSKGELEKFRERVREMSFITDEEAEKLDNEGNILEKYPWVSRDHGAQILRMIHDGTYIVNNFPNYPIQKTTKVEWLTNSEGFAIDSLFCEGCIVVDLDARTFEWHEGFNKTPVIDGRFKNLVPEEVTVKYHPVSLLASFSLDDLPTPDQFVRACSKGEEEEE